MTKRNIIITLTIVATSLFGAMLLFQPALAAKCGGAETSIISCSGEGEDAIFGIIAMVIKIMTGLIGLIAVAAVVFGAVLYGSAGDSPENIKKAKGIWMNVFIGLVLFAFMSALLNFIIPGGVW